VNHSCDRQAQMTPIDMKKIQTVETPTRPPARRTDITRSPARVLQVINEIAQSASGLSLARIAALTKLPKTSLFTLLRSLEASHYVINVGGVFRLGPAMLAVAAAISKKERFLPAARPTLQALYAETGETVQLGILAEDEPAAETVEVLETKKPVRLSFPVGLRRPLYCSSIGKLLLACQASEWIDDFLSRTELVAYTSHTITDRQVLLRELAEIRKSGLSISHESMFEDASGISGAIWDDTGRMLGGVSVTAPTYRMRRDEARFKSLVRAAAEEISRRLGFVGPYPLPVAEPPGESVFKIQS
jgi:DNA-binding IclR family transcriptional regulator